MLFHFIDNISLLSRPFHYSFYFSFFISFHIIFTPLFHYYWHFLLISSSFHRFVSFSLSPRLLHIHIVIIFHFSYSAIPFFHYSLIRCPLYYAFWFDSSSRARHFLHHFGLSFHAILICSFRHYYINYCFTIIFISLFHHAASIFDFFHIIHVFFHISFIIFHYRSLILFSFCWDIRWCLLIIFRYYFIFFFMIFTFFLTLFHHAIWRILPSFIIFPLIYYFHIFIFCALFISFTLIFAIFCLRQMPRDILFFRHSHWLCHITRIRRPSHHITPLILIIDFICYYAYFRHIREPFSHFFFPFLHFDPHYLFFIRPLLMPPFAMPIFSLIFDIIHAIIIFPFLYCLRLIIASPFSFSFFIRFSFYFHYYFQIFHLLFIPFRLLFHYIILFPLLFLSLFRYYFITPSFYYANVIYFTFSYCCRIIFHITYFCFLHFTIMPISFRDYWCHWYFIYIFAALLPRAYYWYFSHSLTLFSPLLMLIFAIPRYSTLLFIFHLFLTLRLFHFHFFQ